MTDDPHETVFPLPVWFVVLATLLFGLWPSVVFSEPLYQTQAEGAVITLHSEKCQLKEVTNLPHRITWEEKGKVTEGCFGHKQGIVIFYFLDRTVGIIPAQIFEKVVGV